MKHCMLLGLVAAFAVTATAFAEGPVQTLVIPDVASTSQRPITVDDLSALRRIDVLSVSPDRSRFAILVRQADAASNSYHRGWFVGSTRGGPLLPIGDGGAAPLAAGVNNRIIGGAFERPAVRWSADGQWLAYTLSRDGETQLWRSRADGSDRQQLTHNAGDVHELEWSDDGKSIYFNAGTARAELDARAEAKARSGYHYDTDLNSFSDFMLPRLEAPGDAARSVGVVTLSPVQERLANDAERTAFERAQARSRGAGKGLRHAAAGRAMAFAERADGAQAWTTRADPQGFLLSIHAVLGGPTAKPRQCAAPACTGLIEKVWWRDDGAVLFLRREGLGYEVQAFYSWLPDSGAVKLVARMTDDVLTHCEPVADKHLLCALEAPTRPPYVAAINLKSGKVNTIADINPEFRNIALGKVERFEWNTPTFKWNQRGAQLEGAYPDRAFGYILYPPGFDPARKYPVFISPYAASGFDNLTNQEYALHALAAQGFVVLSTQFPQAALDIYTRLGANFGKLLYSAELGFPHLSMYMESTLKALDEVTARGFIDASRVGIGGVSHGAFVPLYMLQKHDRIAAVSVSGGGWDALEYYSLTPSGRKAAVAGYSWLVKPDAEGLSFWRQISLADNVETIEAPLLINATAAETFGLLRLINHMAEAGKPYDAYVFPRETHLKWQPAHLLTIMRRNLDWFRFWLQSAEDPDPAKAEQYSRWRTLREHRKTQTTEPRSASPGDPQ